MSNTDQNEPDPKSAAREALLKAIPEAVEKAASLNPAGRAEALHKLAEAYSWVTNPAQPH